MDMGESRIDSIWAAKGHYKLSGEILVPELDNADPDNPFYDKKVVFTGVLQSISRADAAVIVKRMGADINTTISGSTEIVIVGSDAGPSKMAKIADLNTRGANIRIIHEPEFLEMIQ
jgi:DNA polymerase-3 subunit epsilon